MNFSNRIFNVYQNEKNSSLSIMQLISVALLGLLLTSCGDVDFTGQTSLNQKNGAAGIGDDIASIPEDLDGGCDDDTEKVDSHPEAARCKISAETPIYAQSSLALPAGAIRRGDLSSFEGAYRSVYLVADSVERVGVAARDFSLNAGSIGSLQGSMMRSDIVAQSIDTVHMATATNCISAESIGSIQTSTGSLALLGRRNAEVASSVDVIRMSAGFALVKDFTIKKIEGAVRAKLINTKVNSLTGAGELILQDSVVENLTFTGKVTCLGNSKILNQPSRCN